MKTKRRYYPSPKSLRLIQKQRIIFNLALIGKLLVGSLPQQVEKYQHKDLEKKY